MRYNHAKDANYEHHSDAKVTNLSYIQVHIVKKSTINNAQVRGDIGFWGSVDTSNSGYRNYADGYADDNDSNYIAMHACKYEQVFIHPVSVWRKLRVADSRQSP